MFTKNPNLPIGLDISDETLKIIQFKKQGKKLKMQCLARYILPKNTIEQGIIKNKKAFIDSLNSMLAKPKFGSPTATETVASLPESKTFIKLIEIEKSTNELKDVIETEIEKYIPLAVKEMYFDWQLVEERNDKYLVLVGAAPKAIVDGYIGLIDSTKLSVVAMEIEATAICRSLLTEESPLAQTNTKNNYGIIDIGAKRSSMIIYSENTIITTISLPISGDETTGRIAQTLEIKKDHAEKAKIICGLDSTKAQGIVNDILSDMINQLIEKIEETIDFYSATYSDLGPLNNIVLCGGGSNIKNLPQIVFEKTGIKTTVGNPLINVNFANAGNLGNLKKILNLNIETNKNDNDEKISVKQNSLLSYSTAIGLALRNLFVKNDF